MINNASSLLNKLDLSLDYIISVLSIGIEIYLQQKLDTLQYFSITLLALAGFAKLVEKKKLFGIKQGIKLDYYGLDYTPIFFWSLALVRVVFIKNIKEDQAIFWLYNLGFSNGQYMSITPTKFINHVTQLVKAFVQFGLLVGLFIYYFEDQLVSSILLIIMMLFIQYQNYRQNIKLIEPNKEEQYFSSNANLNGSLNKFIPKQQEQPKSKVKLQEEGSLSRQEASMHLMPDQVDIQAPTQKTMWQQFIEQSEDYISKFYFSMNDLENNINQASNNYSMNKLLQDNKIQLASLFKQIKVSNDLNVKLYESNNLDKKQVSFFEWIEANANSFKFSDLNYQRGLEENLVISQQINQQSIEMIGAFIDKQLSVISAIQLISGFLEVSNLKNRKFLYGKYNGTTQNYNFYIQINFFEEEVDGVQRQVTAVLIRDLEKQVQQIKTNLKNMQKINSTIKFLKQQADLIQSIHKKINLQEKTITEILNQKQKSTNLVKTNSIYSQKDSIDDALSEISEKAQKNCQITQFIKQLQFQFMKITQNNFNYFEVFSLNEFVQLEKNKVDITQTINLLINQFHYDEIVIGQKISITMRDQLKNRCIITDIRRLKQLLFNIIYNSIKSYEDDLENSKIKKRVKIVLKNYDEQNIRFEIIDYGCGLTDDNINSKRLDDCKLGLAASQKLIKILGGNNNQIKIYRSQSKKKTKVIFELPQTLFVDKAEIMGGDFDFDTIQLVFTS
ncbi:unnamed protein product (macronuclear) [Paramecium tetraurelia]|uniref:Histidine kinase domain-containing protein n=1 Tax=Paramecium tetraurelia TaxID=5888 RepID=A0DZQ9_PARTE|nr:uncharacterized protein GSPATT00021694001 [Paramecium tetraurelia]CAK88526.1 unnamed protein product [Paramecium tetraurelia]|eukprot:XP_001455923.1 hypothetical protein (macronuclear) [Paramecium tetraurelia strain d4-2]